MQRRLHRSHSGDASRPPGSDGRAVAAQIAGANDGRCLDARPGDGDSHVFNSPRPCQAAASGTAAIDVGALPNGGQVEVWEMNQPDLKATHTSNDDRKVRPATRTVSPSQQGGSMSYTFPAHSLTILRLTLQ